MLCVGNEDELHGMQPLPPRNHPGYTVACTARQDRRIRQRKRTVERNDPVAAFIHRYRRGQGEAGRTFQLVWKDLPGPLLI